MITNEEYFLRRFRLWVGLAWDGAPVMHSARLDRYAAAAERLKAMGLLYPCQCTRAEIVAAATAAGPDGPLYVVYVVGFATPHTWLTYAVTLPKSGRPNYSRDSFRAPLLWTALIAAMVPLSGRALWRAAASLDSSLARSAVAIARAISSCRANRSLYGRS